MSEFISQVIKWNVKDFSEIDYQEFPKTPFITIVETDFESADDKQLEKLGRKLIDTNVMAIAALSKDCEGFHDLVDHLYVIKNLDDLDNVPNIVTTWHDHETLEEVVEYYANSHYPDEELKVDNYELLILTVEN